MSEVLAASDNGYAAPDDAPVITAAKVDIAPAPAPMPNPMATIVPSVMQAVANHPAIPEAHAADVVASILSTIYQDLPAIYQVSRASAKTQGQVGLGFGLLASILSLFMPHPQ